MASNQTPDIPAQNNSNSSQQSFNSTPSSRAIGLVAIAVMIGILLLVIVDSDNSSGNKNASAQETVTTTTIQSNSENSSSETTPSTTVQVSGTKKPAEVSIVVLNGSSISGIATSVSNAVGENGYKMLTPGNDSSTAKGTIVYYKAGFQKDAQQISTNIVPAILTDLEISQDVTAQQFPASAPVEWDQDNLISANIVIVVGNS